MKEDEQMSVWNTWARLADSDPEQLLTALVSSPDIGVAVLDRKFRYEAINPALAAMNGIPVEQHLGKTLREILGDSATQLESAFERVFRSGTPVWNFELSTMLPTRAEVGHWMESHLPIKDKAGNVKQIGVVVVEITKQKQLEEAVRNLSEKLEQERQRFLTLAQVNHTLISNRDLQLSDDVVHHLSAKLEQERERLRTLLDVNRTLLSNLDLQNLFSAITQSVSRIVPHDFAGISIYNPERKGMEMWVLASPDSSKVIAQGEVVLREESLAWQAFDQKQAKTFGHDDLARMNSQFANHILESGIQKIHCVPLQTSKGILGVLEVGSSRENAFSEADQELLKQIADQVAIALDNARAYREIEELKDKLTEEKLYLEGEIISELGFEEIIGDSPALKRVLGQTKIVAATEATVLILGETGTGKELIARAVHRMSKRKDNSFIKINCAAIPTGLLESELFGHEKGAFTGAITQKVGRLELADKGTMFLDEVGDIPLELQPKLLRVLQDQEFERLGGTKTIRVNVRIIAATNRDLAKSVADRQFRSDLYYRLRVFPIHIPPLRERRKDIPQLVRYFVQKFARRMNKQIDTITSETMNALMDWDWPGNIRELENLIERSVILTQGTVLRPPLAELQAPEAADAAANATLEAAEREHIARILRETRGVISGAHGAAAKLGLKRTTLQSKMQKLGLSRDQYRA
jgi:formate hydrogenlyase transcriptional activator